MGTEKVAFPVNGSFCKDFKADWLKPAAGAPPPDPELDIAIERVVVVLGGVSGVEEAPDEEVVLPESDLAGAVPEEAVDPDAVEPDEEVSANARSCRHIVRICVIINEQDMIL